MKFPSNFLWGTATSAYQVEGNIKNSDWTEFKDAGRACDHYNKFKEDFDLAKKLNNNAYRLSIEWSRIEPEQGRLDEKEIEHYRQVIVALKQRNLEPFVTLHHFTNPIWFVKKGGWLNQEAPEIFGQYVERIAENLGDKIKFWTTINEPLIYALNSFLIGSWPPQKKSLLNFLRVLSNLIKAHKKAHQIIHKILPEAQIGIAQSVIYFDGPFAFFGDYFWNEWFLDKIKNEQDFIGANYYYRLKFPKKKNREASDLNWEIFPQGIYYILKEMRKYKKPIYITENGLADAKDEKREKFIREHLFWIHKAMEEGADVRGYFHWSLLDNFEWAKGFEPRFGLFKMDYQTLERKIRKSAEYYAEVCESNQL